MAKQRNATDVTVKKLLIHTASKDYNLEPHLLELNITMHLGSFVELNKFFWPIVISFRQQI